MDRSFGRRTGDQSRAGPQRVLIGLEDPTAAGNLAKLFDETGLLATLAFSCERLVGEARQDVYGLIVLDDGFACKHDVACLEKVRAGSAVPIVFVGKGLDHKETDVDLVLDPDEEPANIAARASLLMQLNRGVRLPALIQWGPLQLDVERHEARWQDRDVHLTAQQFRIMEVLVMAAGRVVTVEQLGRRVWGDAGISDLGRLVAHVRRIRQRIEEDPSSPRFLLRVRNGFRLADADAVDDGRSSSDR